MSLFKLGKNNIDVFQVLSRPKRVFTSASSGGVTGDIRVFPDTSTLIKEVSGVSVELLVPGGAPAFSDSGLDFVRLAALSNVDESSMQLYLDTVNSVTNNSRFDKRVEILRFEPSVKFTSDTLRKNVIRKNLYPYYRPKYGKAYNWAFTNYNTLNFFDSNSTEIPADTVLMYPASGSYAYRPTGSFSFEFYLNPRYKGHGKDTYHAGTLLHLSSSYAVSLVSGSSRDLDGYVDKFRLMLQLSHSADLPPSECTIGLTGSPSAPNDFIFSSSDNSLTRNTWHHCCIRWDNNTQNSQGSFVVDGKQAGTFEIPDIALSGSYLQRELPHTTTREGMNVALGPPDVLFVGNFYDGPNSLDPSGDEDFTAQFFNPTVAYTDGLPNFYTASIPSTPSTGGSIPADPDDFSFTHPLNAEVHELKIYTKYRTDGDIQSAVTGGFSSVAVEKEAGLIFYVPPYFVKDTPVRNILQTPFQSTRGKTDDPFNVALSFGIGGHYLNLENFVKDFASGSFPRLYNLSASEVATSTDWLGANQFLFATGSVRKRNLTILPNDNGLFNPIFDILAEGTDESALSLYVDDMGKRDLSLVHLDNLVSTASAGFGLEGAEDEGTIANQLQGPTPTDPSVPAGSILTILNRTKDPSSNEIVVFDASNLFYGNRIHPGTYSLEDTAVTGSGGRVSVTLKDYSGSLYRSDCLSKQATWNSVGTMMYDEGISVVTTPLIPRFGVDKFTVNLEGEQNTHVLRIDIPAERATLDFSQNPTFKRLKPTAQLADRETSFCYITNVNLHDENLNVISKTNYSQAIIKRENDRFIIRVKLDF